MDFPEHLIAGCCKFRQERLATEQERYRILAETGHLMIFPFVRTAVEQGRLRLHGAYFHVATGALATVSSLGDPASGRFAAVPAA